MRSKWTTALRSGDYVQGKGQLRLTDRHGVVKHCCLGVLCDLAAADGVVAMDEIAACGFLPHAVVVWAGVDSDDPEIHGDFGDEDTASLTSLNDDGMDFGRIADLIDGKS